MSTLADKMVKWVNILDLNETRLLIFTVYSFNVHGIIFVGEDGIYFSFLICICPITYLLSPETIAPIEREIRSLAIGLQSVKDEQEYIVVRERTHRNTAESTNSRVKWWSILQAGVLFSVVGWQIYYLKVIQFSNHPL